LPLGERPDCAMLKRGSANVAAAAADVFRKVRRFGSGAGPFISEESDGYAPPW
jgi:hypothetical protein